MKNAIYLVRAIFVVPWKSRHFIIIYNSSNVIELSIHRHYININIKIQCYWAHHRLLATVNFGSIEVPAINNKGRFSAVKFWKILKITYTKLTKRHDFPGIVLYKAIKHMYICHIWRLRNVLNLKNGEKCVTFALIL